MWCRGAGCSLAELVIHRDVIPALSGTEAGKTGEYSGANQPEGHICLGRSPGPHLEGLEHKLTNLARHPEVTDSKFSKGHAGEINK